MSRRILICMTRAMPEIRYRFRDDFVSVTRNPKDTVSWQVCSGARFKYCIELDRRSLDARRHGWRTVVARALRELRREIFKSCDHHWTQETGYFIEQQTDLRTGEHIEANVSVPRPRLSWEDRETFCTFTLDKPTLRTGP